MSKSKPSNYRKGMFNQYLVEVSNNSPANKLQKAISDVAATWDNVLLTGSPEDFSGEIDQLLSRLNAGYPRCTPIKTQFSSYAGMNASVYLTVGVVDGTFLTVTFTAVRAVRTTLMKGGVAK